MMKTISIAAIILMMAGFSSFADEPRACSIKPSECKKITCSTCVADKVCEKCMAKKEVKKCGADCTKRCCA